VKDDEKIESIEAPNSIQTPQQFFELMPKMLDCEVRVTGCIIHKTFGYDKQADVLSISQLELGTEMSKPSVIKGVKLAEERGTVFTLKFGNPGEEFKLVMLNTQKNRRLRAKYLNGDLSDGDFLLMCGIDVSSLKGGERISRTENSAVKKKNGGGKTVLPVKSFDTQIPDPDLTPLVTDHSLSLSTPEQKTTVPGSAARGSLPEPAETGKPIERERENFAHAHSKTGKKTAAPRDLEAETRAEMASRDPDSGWDLVPAHVKIEKGPGLSELHPRIVREFRQQTPQETPPTFRGAPPPAEAFEPDGTPTPEQVAKREARLAELERQKDLLEAREKSPSYQAMQKAEPASPPPAKPAPRPRLATKAEQQAYAAELMKPADDSGISPLAQRLMTAAEANRDALQAADDLLFKGSDPRNLSFSTTPQATEARKEDEAKQAAARLAAQTERERLAALALENFAAFVDEMYPACVDNPDPHKDRHNVDAFKLAGQNLLAQARQRGEDARALADKMILGFWKGKGKVHCLKPILNNLQELGLVFTGMRGAAHA
jgi:hypothetical protein